MINCIHIILEQKTGRHQVSAFPMSLFALVVVVNILILFGVSFYSSLYGLILVTKACAENLPLPGFFLFYFILFYFRQKKLSKFFRHQVRACNLIFLKDLKPYQNKTLFVDPVIYCYNMGKEK